MEKLGLLFKQALANRIKKNSEESNSVFLVNYSGLSSFDLNVLRQSLKNNKADLFVVKNSVARRILKDSKLDPLIKSFEGPCGLVFVKEEPVSASKLLYDFAKEHEALKLQIAYVEDRVLDNKGIQDVAKLPSKIMLQAKLVGTLQSPIAKLVCVLNGNLRKLVYCLAQIKTAKEKKTATAEGADKNTADDAKKSA